MTEPESPTRAAWITADGFGLACKCGTTIHVEVEVRGEIDPDRLTQFAVTCDTCGASHWVTPVPLDGDAATREAG